MRTGNTFRNVIAGFALTLALLPGSVLAAGAPQHSASERAVATQTEGNFLLENHAIGAKWTVAAGKINKLVIMDRLHGTELRVAAPFAILGSMVFLRERVGVKLALGAAVTLAGVFLATLAHVS